MKRGDLVITRSTQDDVQFLIVIVDVLAQSLVTPELVLACPIFVGVPKKRGGTHVVFAAVAPSGKESTLTVCVDVARYIRSEGLGEVIGGLNSLTMTAIDDALNNLLECKEPELNFQYKH